MLFLNVFWFVIIFTIVICCSISDCTRIQLETDLRCTQKNIGYNNENVEICKRSIERLEEIADDMKLIAAFCDADQSSYIVRNISSNIQAKERYRKEDSCN